MEQSLREYIYVRRIVTEPGQHLHETGRIALRIVAVGSAVPSGTARGTVWVQWWPLDQIWGHHTQLHANFEVPLSGATYVTRPTRFGNGRYAVRPSRMARAVLPSLPRHITQRGRGEQTFFGADDPPVLGPG
jgi:hypothetical protein